MSLATVLEIASAVLGLFSACFFCVGVLHVKRATLELLATQFYGVGETIAIELAKQKADFVFGACLLFMSFMLQSVPKVYPGAGAFSVADEVLNGVILGFAMPVFALSALYVPWRLQRKKWVSAIEKAVQKSEQDARQHNPKPRI